MEPGVANREGKGAIKRAENEKSHSQNSGNDPPGADTTRCVGVGDRRLFHRWKALTFFPYT